MSEYRSSGRVASLILDDVYERDITILDFCPLTDSVFNDGTAKNTALRDQMMRNGFYVKPNTDGDLYVITVKAYEDNKFSFTGLQAVNLNGKAGVWEPVLVVKVFSQMASTTTTDSEGEVWFSNSASDFINIGLSRS